MNKLSQYLSQNKISQSDFAKLIKRDQTLVSKLMRDKVAATLENAQRIDTATRGAVQITDWPNLDAVVKAASQSSSVRGLQ